MYISPVVGSCLITPIVALVVVLLLAWFAAGSSSSSSSAAVEGQRAAAGGTVVVVKVLLPDLARSSFGWGQVQLVECGRLPASSPPNSSSGQEQQLACRPSAGVMCTPSTQVHAILEGRGDGPY